MSVEILTKDDVVHLEKKMDSLERKIDFIVSQMDNEWAGTEEVCVKLGISRSTFDRIIDKLIVAGLKKVGGRWKIRRHDLTRYILEQGDAGE